jgi:hypothetical protein
MPTRTLNSRSAEAAQNHATPTLLLAVGLLAPFTLHAQSDTLQTTLVAATSASSKLAALPDAPIAVVDPARMGTELPAATAFPGAHTPGSPTSFPSFRQRERRFLLDLAGPAAFIAPAFQAGIDTARPLKVGYPPDGFPASENHPAHGDVPEWGEGAQGYAKRYADRFGQGLVGTTSRYALGELLREEVTYHRCQCTGLVPRTAHAFLGAYTAHTRNGRTVPSLPAVASPFIASEVAVAAWYPRRYDASDALRISVLNYVAAPFKNLFAEFIAK